MAGSSRFRGIYAHKDGGFVASIGVGGKHTYLGYFKDFEAAKRARLDAEVQFFGAAFDRREVEVLMDHARIPLHGQGGKFYGWALIDLTDLPVASPIAWTVDPRGYVAGRPAGMPSSVTMHRWLMLGGRKGPVAVDHIDGDKLNNRRSNLRLCSPAENSRNTKIGKSNRSGFKGVSPTPCGKWRARIMVDRKEIFLGKFETAEQARDAYDKAAIQMHGAFASPNNARQEPIQ